MNPGNQKRVLRRDLRKMLAELAPTARPASGAALISQLIPLPAWQNARRVMLFAPMPVEPDLDALWGGGQLTGKTCAYPVVNGTGISLYRVTSLDALRPVPPWKLREPIADPAAQMDINDFDAMLVPGLAFDDSGGRLGRGGGFYDRLLAQRHGKLPIAIGIGFTFQRLDSVPLEPHDALLDFVIFC